MTTPLDTLRSTGPHAGLAALSAELWAAWMALPKPQRVALALRDEYPRTGELALAAGIAVELGGPWSDALKLARAALRETRGILDPDGKVTR